LAHPARGCTLSSLVGQTPTTPAPSLRSSRLCRLDRSDALQSSATPYPTILLFPPARCTLHFTSLHFTSACIAWQEPVSSFRTPPPVRLLPGRTRLARDSTTWKSAFACCCRTAEHCCSQVSLFAEPYHTLISHPKPGFHSPSLLLGHHITSNRGVQEHESARPAARW
jgi:hypothetical protein